MVITELSGHSGCQVLLCENEKGAHFVRKISASREYNVRLVAQQIKQQCYLQRGILAPRILDSGFTDDGCYYFDMEYVKGITLSKYIQTIEVSSIRPLVENIVNTIMIGTHQAKPIKAAPCCTIDLFCEKIRDTERKIPQQHKTDTIKTCFEILQKHDWSSIPEGDCHGDLTLENIIINGDRLYYIDFLDSFFDSCVMDFAKLLQDTQTMWSYRNEDNVNTNTTIRLKIFRDVLRQLVQEKMPAQFSELEYVLLLHLARIYPYAKDTHTLAFLDTKVALTIRQIRGVS